jgi:hypothetical protein
MDETDVRTRKLSSEVVFARKEEWKKVTPSSPSNPLSNLIQTEKRCPLHRKKLNTLHTDYGRQSRQVSLDTEDGGRKGRISPFEYHDRPSLVIEGFLMHLDWPANAI